MEIVTIMISKYSTWGPWAVGLASTVQSLSYGGHGDIDARGSESLDWPHAQ